MKKHLLALAIALTAVAANAMDESSKAELKMYGMAVEAAILCNEPASEWAQLKYFQGLAAKAYAYMEKKPESDVLNAFDEGKKSMQKDKASLTPETCLVLMKQVRLTNAALGPSVELLKKHLPQELVASLGPAPAPVSQQPSEDTSRPKAKNLALP